ncbi:MAG: SGNH/GDSL hydrolase family protein [Taibaiella sp.]|nr:SGNH/GDSL hydrolase family protein [Taibaiella sp.]
MNKRNYLALGDSYTIGEGVAADKNFPNQLVSLLQEEHNIEFQTPEIIAVTGWTTDELKAGIAERDPQGPYDLVTLLIGVNNQYRGRDVGEYKTEFEALLEQAISFAGGNYKHVIVVSIPDWGHTPFAREKEVDESKVAAEIALFNEAKQAVTLAKGVRFLDITGMTKTLAQDTAYLVEDQLHYSDKLYREWAECLAPLVSNMFSSQ